MTDQCNNCRYAKKPALTLPNSDLECHRYPPTTSIGQSVKGVALMTIWPVVKPDNYCGEHELYPTQFDKPGKHLQLDPRAKPIVTIERDASTDDIVP